MRPFSRDLRERVLADFQSGASFAELARRYHTSAEWVRQFIRRYQSTGEIAARPPIPRRVPFHRRYEAELRAAIAAQPDLTLEGLRAKLGLDVSIATLHTALKELKLSFKKKRWSRPSRAGPTSRRNGGNSARPSKSASIRTASSSLTKPV
jgi:putative transposase